MIRVHVPKGCTGMGSCVRLAPSVFRIDPSTGRAQVLVDDATPWREQVLQAARSCPFVVVEQDGVLLSEPIDEVVVVSTRRLTPDVIELRLRRSGFKFSPGQYVFVRFKDDKGEFFRSYSVVDAADGVVTLCIRLVPNGRAGSVLRDIEAGTTLGLSSAKGLFGLVTPDKPKLFVTGGTGLAPVLSMCRAAPQARKRVVFGGRNPGDMFWLDELRAVPNTEVITIVQTPDATWQGAVGLVTAPLDQVVAAEWPEVYTCGSPGMVEAVRKVMVARGVPADAVYSDSFLAAGAAPPPAAAGSAPQPSYDWAGLFRRVHVFTSLPLALVLLFYAITGFVANRSELFLGEAGTAPASRHLPDGQALDRAALAPYLAGMLPAEASLESWQDTPPQAVFRSGDRGWRVRVDPESRNVRIEAIGSIPAETALTPASLAQQLSGRLSGHVDAAKAEDDDSSCCLEFESVWGTHRVNVDKATRTWTASSTRPYLVVSLVDLHRGKQAGAWQRLIIDAAALVLALVTITGAAMGLLAAAPGRRRQTLILIGVSAILLTLLLLAR